MLQHKQGHAKYCKNSGNITFHPAGTTVPSTEERAMNIVMLPKLFL